jgi:hypothetical protein
MSKILNQSQAKAVYAAMCELNNVSLNSGIELSFVGQTPVGSESPMQRVTVAENADGEVVVFTGWAMRQNVQRENYATQAAFAAAYGLGEPVSFF